MKHHQDRKESPPCHRFLLNQERAGDYPANLPQQQLEGVYPDRTEASLKPRFVKVELPTDTDIAAGVQKISRRVIRQLRHLGYLETGSDGAVPTGHDPLRDDAPELARTMAASVQQRIVFGERSGQKVRRIGAGFGHAGETPTFTGPHRPAGAGHDC